MKTRNVLIACIAVVGLLAGCGPSEPSASEITSRTKNASVNAAATAAANATLTQMQENVQQKLRNFFGFLAGVVPTTTTVSPTTTKPATTSTAPRATSTTSSVAVTTLPPTTTIAPAGPCTATKCRIGDTGPNGGTVFITPTTPGNASGWFFETKAGSFGREYKFGCGSASIPFSGSAIGDGPSNTAKIQFICGKSSVVGGLTATSTADPSKNWFLPSSGELIEILKNTPILKGDAGSRYGQFWSSTVNADGSIMAANIGGASVSPRPRDQTYDLALVAAFAPDLSPVQIVDKPRTYAIGDAGPGGGLVFITPSTKGNSTGKYFEIAPTNWSGTPISQDNVVYNPQVGWSCPEYWEKSLPGTATGIGAGAANTDVINKACAGFTGINRYATAEAVKYRGGGRSDWFVPSKDELIEMYKNMFKVTPSLAYMAGGRSFMITCAWSSSEMSNAVGYGGNQLLASDVYATKKQIETNCVIPVRMFDASETFGTKG